MTASKSVTMLETQENNQTENQTSASEESSARESGFFHRLQHAAHRKLPWLIPDPDYRHRLAAWRRRDDEKNARTEPPPDELVDLRCIWAVEYYTPAHIDKLLDGFSSLGWNLEDQSLPGRNPAVWIQQSRESPHSGGWLNLGLIDRPGANRFVGYPRTASLPEDADFALGGVFAVTSSITCVVMGFVLKEEAARRFDQALRRTHETYMEPLKRGHAIIGPYHQKQAAIRAIRTELRTSAADWFRNFLPGLFSSKTLSNDIPTCEFVTLRKGRPFPRREDGAARPDEYLSLLEMDHDLDAWEAVDVPGLKLTWPLFHYRDTKFHAILAANELELDHKRLESYGGAERSSYGIYMNEHIGDLLTRWALLYVLSEFERHLNAIRDSTTLRPHQKQEPLRVLEMLTELVSQSADIPAVSSELSRLANEPTSFDHNVETFRPCQPKYYRNKNPTLTKILRETIAERAEWLGNTDTFVRNLMIQYGTVIGARENTKVQQSVRRLTWILVVLTIFIAILTAMMAYNTWQQAESKSDAGVFLPSQSVISGSKS